MLTIPRLSKIISDSRVPVLNNPFYSRLSLISVSSSTLSSVIVKVENNQISRVKSIVKVIKSTAHSIFKRFIKKITRENMISHAESEHLIGMTIDPRIARVYENKINFNGTGRIESLKKNIEKNDYYVLINK